ncbi:MAG: hypothetical protein B7Z63_06760, partial [Ignavibacteriae bacterium 37-53-5]
MAKPSEHYHCLRQWVSTRGYRATKIVGGLHSLCVRNKATFLFWNKHVYFKKSGCSPQWILEGDIKGCFDNIDHNWLMTNVPTDKRILQKWLKAGFIHRQLFSPTVAGTPQGGIISPTVANWALDGLEKELKEHFHSRYLVHMVRYADDFVITGRSKELLEQDVRPVVEAFLRVRGLELSKEKTRITHIQEGFDFLGQNVRKYGDKLLIKPSRNNVKAFL